MTVTVTDTVRLDETADRQQNDTDLALPTVFSGRLADLNAGSPIEKAVSSGSVITITDGGTVTDIAFTDSGGSSGLETLTGNQIFLYTDTNNNIVLGREGSGTMADPTGAIVFAVYLDETGTPANRFWSVLFEPLKHPDATNPDDFKTAEPHLAVTASTTVEFDFQSAPSGSNLFLTVGNANNGLVVTGRHPVLQADGTYTNQSDVIHTSQGGIEATIGVNNQMFDEGDGAFFTYVNNPNPNFLAGATNGLTQTEADDADNILYTGGTFEASTASFLLSQIQGNAAATVKISAFNIDDSPQARDFVSGLGTGGTPDITAVRVFNAAGTKIEDTGTGLNDPNVGVDLAGLTAVVSGLNAGYKVEWDTAAPHDQVLIEGVAGKFDIGGFELSQPQPTPDEVLPFTVQIADFDGDTASAPFSVGIDGTGIFDDDHVDGVNPTNAVIA